MSDLVIEQAPARPDRRVAPPPAIRLAGGAVAGACLLALLIGLALLGLLALTPRQGELFEAGLAPALEGGHWFGTDAAGRDVLARVLGGLGVTLLLGVGASLVALALGLIWGAAGFLGGGAALARFVDAFRALPLAYFSVGLLLVVRFDDAVANLLLLCLVVGASESLSLAGLARGYAACLRRQPFIDAARLAGAKPDQIVARHIAPDIIAPMLQGAALVVPAIVLGESLLSFVGLGAQAPFASLGRLIADGGEQMQTAPWVSIAPTTILFALLLALRLLGAGLRETIETPPQRSL